MSERYDCFRSFVHFSPKIFFLENQQFYDYSSAGYHRPKDTFQAIEGAALAHKTSGPCQLGICMDGLRE
jgi:hypothetical protein